MKSNLKRKGFGFSMLFVAVLLAMTIGLCVFAAYPDVKIVVTEENADLKVTYLGNSLRKDSEDYSKTCIRFGYQFDLPEGKEMKDYTWKWEYSTDGKELDGEDKSVDGTDWLIVNEEEGIYESNLVITNIPANYYERTFYVKLIVTDNDTKETVTIDTVMNRTIRDLAETIVDENKNDTDTAYATNINKKIAEYDAKVDDVIFTTVKSAVSYAAKYSISEAAQKTVVIRDNMTLDSAIDIPTGADVAIKDDGTAHTLTRSADYYSGAPLFRVYGGAKLTFTSTQTNQQAITSEDEVNESITDMLVIDGNNEVVGESMSGNSPIILVVSTTDENSGTTDNTEGTGGVVTIQSGVAFVNNTNASNGGAIHMEADAYGQLNIQGGRFEKNTTSATRGGVIQVYKNNSVDISNAVFTSNSANYGAVFALGNNNAATAAGIEAEINQCVFSANSANKGSGVFTSYVSEEEKFVITNSILKGNTAPTQGVGQIVGALKTEGCKYTGNQATDTSAGVFYFAAGSVADITTCDFTGNTSNTYGGVMIAKTSDITIDDCTFTSNAATTNGGVFADHEDSTGNTNITITGSEFDGNTAGDSTNTSTGGGVLYLSAADIVTISEKCEFKNNNCRQLGGVIGIKSASSITIDDCTFDTNKTINTGTSYGGAIATDPDGEAGQVVIGNTTFSGNKSRNGGAIFVGKNSSLKLQDGSIFTDNDLNTTKGAGKDCMLNGSASELELSGKVQTNFYISTSTIKVVANITAALTEGSSVIFDWASPTKVPTAAITFASEEIMNSSKTYISLNSNLSSYTLNYVSEADSWYATLATAE